MGRSQRQEEPPGRGDSRTKDLLGDKLVSLRGRNKVEVGRSPQVKRGAWARGVQGEVTVATAAGQPVNGGRVKRAVRRDFSTCAANPFLPETKEASFHRGLGLWQGLRDLVRWELDPCLNHSPGSTTPMWVPVPSLGSAYLWQKTRNSHHKPWWTAGEVDLVIPTLALGLELGRRAAGMHNAQDSCLPYIPDATRQPCH